MLRTTYAICSVEYVCIRMLRMRESATERHTQVLIKMQLSQYSTCAQRFQHQHQEEVDVEVAVKMERGGR